MPLDRKPSAEATAERRQMVARLKLEGKSNAEIGRLLDVNRKTIILDVKRLREAARQAAAGVDRFEEVGKAAFELLLIAQEAWQGYHESTDGADKNRFLITAMTAICKRFRLLLDSGIISGAPLEVNLSVEELRKMPTEEIMRRRGELLRQLAEEVNGQSGSDKPAPPTDGDSGESRAAAG